MMVKPSAGCKQPGGLLVPCLAAFAAGALATKVFKKQDMAAEVPYGDMRLRVSADVADRFSDSGSIIFDTPMEFQIIGKKSSRLTFSERLAAFHRIPVSPLWTVQETRELLTDEFLAESQQYFSIPQYTAIVRQVLLPVFMDEAERCLVRFCRLQTPNVTFTFYCPATGNCDEEMKLQSEIRSAMELTLTLMRTANMERSKLKVTVFMNEFPKEFDPSLRAPVGSARFINSGLTSSSEQVFIYRRQEMIKVVCHEVIHALKLDCYDQSDTMVLAVRGTSASVKGIFNPAEAVTEVIARLIYTLHCSESEGFGSDGNDLSDMLEQLLQFSIRQAAALLHMGGLKSCSELEKGQYHQDTYAFEYYVLSAALLYGIAQEEPKSGGTESVLLSRVLRRSSSYKIAVTAADMMVAELLPGSGFRDALDVLLAQLSFSSSLRMTPAFR